MRVEKAREIGFCFGVRRAIRLTEEAARRYGRVESLGPVVHNRQVMERLEGMGVRVIPQLQEAEGRVVVIPTHGLGPKLWKEIEGGGMEVIDATCPLVRQAQQAARGLGQAGFQVLVFGDGGHTEVKGVLGWAGDGATATTGTPALSPFPKKLGVLSQTTQVPEDFSRFIAGLLPQALAQGVELRVVNTICSPTRRRQQAAQALARRSQLMVVIGSFKSNNTTQLTRLCSPLTETRQVETPQDLNPRWLAGRERIGVTSGTSTPDEVVEAVMTQIENLQEG